MAICTCFHPTFCKICNYISMLGLNLTHISKMGGWHWCDVCHPSCKQIRLMVISRWNGITAYLIGWLLKSCVLQHLILYGNYYEAHMAKFQVELIPYHIVIKFNWVLWSQNRSFYSWIRRSEICILLISGLHIDTGRCFTILSNEFCEVARHIDGDGSVVIFC